MHLWEGSVCGARINSSRDDFDSESNCAHDSRGLLIGGRSILVWLYSPVFPGSNLLPAMPGTVVFVYGGLVLISGAWGELADRKPGMITLISLAIMVAFGTSRASKVIARLREWASLARPEGPLCQRNHAVAIGNANRFNRP